MNSPYPPITTAEAIEQMTAYVRDRDDPSIPTHVMAKAWFGVLSQIDAVRDLHRRRDATSWCEVCVDENNDEQPWPCTTIRAIDDSTPDSGRSWAELMRLRALEQRVIEWRRQATEAAKDDPDDHEARLAYEIHTGARPTYYDPAWEDAMRHSYHG